MLSYFKADLEEAAAERSQLERKPSAPRPTAAEAWSTESNASDLPTAGFADSSDGTVCCVGPITRVAGGLGLVFDSQHAVKRVLPGGAAEREGSVRAGDVLLQVKRLPSGERTDVRPGMNVSALFPPTEHQFMLTVRRPPCAAPAPPPRALAPAEAGKRLLTSTATAAPDTAKPDPSSEPIYMPHSVTITALESTPALGPQFQIPGRPRQSEHAFLHAEVLQGDGSVVVPTGHGFSLKGAHVPLALEKMAVHGEVSMLSAPSVTTLADGPAAGASWVRGELRLTGAALTFVPNGAKQLAAKRFVPVGAGRPCSLWVHRDERNTVALCAGSPASAKADVVIFQAASEAEAHALLGQIGGRLLLNRLGLADSEARELLDAFERFDAVGEEIAPRGSVSIAEVHAAAGALGRGCSLETVEASVTQLGLRVSRHGGLELPQFLALLASLPEDERTPRDVMLGAIRALADDGDALNVSVEALREALTSLGSQRMTADEAAAFLEAADRDADGMIDPEELVRANKHWFSEGPLDGDASRRQGLARGARPRGRSDSPGPRHSLGDASSRVGARLAPAAAADRGHERGRSVAFEAQRAPSRDRSHSGERQSDAARKRASEAQRLRERSERRRAAT